MELHLGRSWRKHDDLDIGICRLDVDAALDQLAGWDFKMAPNNVWARRSPDGPWGLDLTIGEGDADRWVYRRDPPVTRPWDEAVLWSRSGVPYLAPDLQLLFKSKDPRAKDYEDARAVIPHLTSAEQEFLYERLPRGHPWRTLPSFSGFPPRLG